MPFAFLPYSTAAPAGQYGGAGSRPAGRFLQQGSVTNQKLFSDLIGSYYRRPSGLKREAGASPAWSRRCNRGRYLRDTTARAEAGWEGAGIRMIRESEDLPVNQYVLPNV